MMKVAGRILLILFTLLILIYFLGPRQPKPFLSKELPVLGVNIERIEKYISDREKQQKLKTDNEARIIWANDSLKEMTEYCLLYLHGFSASWFEGYPANMKFAKRYGCNAYFSRLHSHGIESSDPLLYMTPDNLWESAKEALQIAKILGKKVIIMSTSTGGTLSLKLAAEFPESVHSLIMFSPNIRINNKVAFLVSGPWGLQLTRKIAGSNYRVTNEDFSSRDCQYWYCKYRIESIVYLQQLLDATMKDQIYKAVNVPVFVGYYYKDEENQDKTIKVSAVLEMFNKLGTPADQKVKAAFPNADAHVIACELTSKSLDDVLTAIFEFADDILNLKQAVRQK